MKKILILIFVVLTALLSCMNEVEESEITRIIGLWQRTSLVTITASSGGSDTIYNDYESQFFQFFSDNNEYVEYTYNANLKDYYQKGVYLKDGNVLIITMENGAIFEYVCILKNNNLWLELEKNNSQSKYNLLTKAIQ